MSLSLRRIEKLLFNNPFPLLTFYAFLINLFFSFLISYKSEGSDGFRFSSKSPASMSAKSATMSAPGTCFRSSLRLPHSATQGVRALTLPGFHAASHCPRPREGPTRCLRPLQGLTPEACAAAPGTPISRTFGGSHKMRCAFAHTP